MRLAFLLVGSLCLILAPAAGAAPPPDALDEALEIAGLSRPDLGWEARGWWERYPADVPYKLRHFDDMLAEPLAAVPFMRAMGVTLSKTLAPAVVAGEKGDPNAGALYRAVHDLGINKRFGGFRAYSANLTAELTPLDEALAATWPAANRDTKLVTFGQEAPFPRVADDMKLACGDLPPEVSGPLGRLVLDLLDARRWALLAFRNVTLEQRTRIATRLDLGEKATDALDARVSPSPARWPRRAGS